MEFLLPFASYLLGCLSPGYLLVRRATGADLRDRHTGSTGARNAGRVAGRRVAVAVFTLDLAKGAVAVALGRLLGLDAAGTAACMAAVVAGHVLPVQLRLRGGRGLSTALGAIAVLDPTAALAGLSVAIVVALVTRAPTAAGIAAAAAAPVVQLALGRPAAEVAWVASASALIVAAHARRDAGGYDQG